MVTAIILMNVAKRKINSVAQEITDLDGIAEVYSVSGGYDLIAVIRVKTNDDLSTLVTDKLSEIEAIEKTETMLAFKAYSKTDLDAMFTVGM